MKSIYICHTLYHLLVSLYKYNEGDILILLETIPERDDFLKRLVDLGYNVEPFDEKSLVAKLGRFYSKTTVNMMKKFEGKRIFLFNDWQHIGSYFCRKNIEYILVEDGYNALASKILNKKERLRRKIKRIVYNLPRVRGYSESCSVIEVNDKSIMPRDSRYNKLTEVPRRKLFSSRIDIIDNILKIFEVPEIVENVNKKVLILTQPLALDTGVDPLIDTEGKQMIYYKNIIDEYKTEYEIYLKPHPRDTLDYTILDEVVLMKKYVPMEVYEFIGGYHFDIGITHSSTALNFLTCVDEKIILNKSNL